MMKLNNYLLNLIDNSLSVKNKEEICIYGCSTILKEIYQDIKKFKSKKIVDFICESLGVPYMTFYCWVSGSNPIPISKSIQILKVWKNVLNKSEREVELKFDELYCAVTGFSQNGQRKAILPKELNEEISYIVGYFQGDGHLASTKVRGFRQYSLHFYDANKGVLLKIDELIRKEFSVRGNFYFNSDGKGSWYTLRFTSKPVYLFFERILGLKSGRKTLNVDVPQIIMDADNNIKISFVRGFFDAEGAVGETKKNPWLDIGQASREGPAQILVWIRKILFEMGVNLTDPQKSSGQDFFRLRTSKRETIKRFFDIVGSNHPKKIIRFKEIIEKC